VLPTRSALAVGCTHHGKTAFLCADGSLKRLCQLICVVKGLGFSVHGSHAGDDWKLDCLVRQGGRWLTAISFFHRIFGARDERSPKAGKSSEVERSSEFERNIGDSKESRG